MQRKDKGARNDGQPGTLPSSLALHLRAAAQIHLKPNYRSAQKGCSSEQLALSGKEITDKGKEATKLLDRLKTLQNKRDKLNEKLADKSKKILEELTEAVDDVDRRSQDLVLCQANYDTCLRRILPPGCVAQILT